MKAVLVARVSSFRQAGNVSYEVQFSRCREYVESQAGDVVAEFFDSAPGGAASYDERHGLQKALSLIERREADTLVVYDISRAARDDLVFARLLAETYERGGRLAIAVERQTYRSKAEAEHLLHWTKSATVYELLTLTRRTQSAKRQAMEAGGFIWKPMTGYRLVKKNRIKVLEPDPVTAPYVVAVFERLASGQTKGEVAAWLHASGLDWDTRRIAKLVSDAGLYSGGNREYAVTLEGERLSRVVTFPALISRETARVAQEAAAVGYRARRGVTPYLGVLQCRCGSGVHIARTYGNRRRQLGCNSARRSAYDRSKGRPVRVFCRHTVSEVFVTEVILRYLDEHVANGPEIVERMDATLASLRPQDFRTELAAIATRRSDIAAQLTDAEDFRNVARLLDAELAALDEQEQEYRRRAAEWEDAVAGMKAARDTYARIEWPSLSHRIRTWLDEGDWRSVNGTLASLRVSVVADFGNPSVRKSLRVEGGPF